MGKLYEITITSKFTFDAVSDEDARERGSEAAQQVLRSLQDEQFPEIEFENMNSEAVLRSKARGPSRKAPRVVWKSP